MTSIKICGLQGVEVLKSTIELNVEFIGLVFAKSKRQVTPDQARALITYVKEMRDMGHQVPKVAGVFLNPTEEQLATVMEVAPLDMIQLHGDETPDFCRYVKNTYSVPVFKAFSIRNEETSDCTVSDQLSAETKSKLDAYREYIDVLLIDTYEPKIGGGSGQTFRWEAIPAYATWARDNGIKLFVAGGLHSDNVNELLNSYSLDGVDVSSGVETDGTKDLDKVKSFVERVRQHE